MEYEQFYKFLENRPVKELNDCIHRIVDMVGSRFVTFQPQLESIQQAALSAIANIQKAADPVEADKERVNGILKSVVTNGILVPHGMNGYHRKDLRFVRWFPGHQAPVPNSKTFSLEHKLTPDWFLDQEFQVWLNWNPEGYFEMSRKDSFKFNLSQPANKALVEEVRRAGVLDKRKIDSVTGSEERKKSKASRPATEGPRFKYLSGSSESGSNSDEDHVLTIKSTVSDNGQSALAPSPSAEPMDTVPDHSSHVTHNHQSQRGQSSHQEQDNAIKAEMIRVNNTSSTALSPKAAAPVKPIKGDTVYITGGKYAATEGSVVGLRGMDGDMFRVQIANLVDGGSIIVQVPGSALTLSRPTASRTTDQAESYLSALKRSSEATKVDHTSASTPPKKSPRKSSASHVEERVHPQTRSTRASEAENERSVDEFFNTLSGSDDYFRPQPAQVSDNSNAPLQAGDTSLSAVPKRTSFVSDDSVVTQSLTSPPDMARDVETIYTAEMEISQATETNNTTTYVDGETSPLEASLPACLATSAMKTTTELTSTKNTTGRPRAHIEGGENEAWSFKCKCGDVCSSYENPLYHPKGEWFECSHCSVWSHVQCLLGNVTLEMVAEMPEALCFSCVTKQHRNRSARGASFDSEAPPVTSESVPSQQAPAATPPQERITPKFSAGTFLVEQASEPVVTLPAKIAASQIPEKKRSHKRKAAAAAPTPHLLPGQIVILLKGQHRSEEAEVIEPARAGPVLLPDVYKLRLCGEPGKILQMPLEFITKKVELTAVLQKPPSPVPITAVVGSVVTPLTAENKALIEKGTNSTVPLNVPNALDTETAAAAPYAVNIPSAVTVRTEDEEAAPSGGLRAALSVSAHESLTAAVDPEPQTNESKDAPEASSDQSAEPLGQNISAAAALVEEVEAPEASAVSAENEKAGAQAETAMDQTSDQP